MLLGRYRQRWEHNTKMDFKETEWGLWTGYIIPGEGPVMGSCEDSNEPLSSINSGDFLTT
jgi:hypothetical protein